MVIPNGAAACMAMMAMMRLRAQRAVVVDVDRAVAVEGDQGRRADINCVGAQRHRFGSVDAVPDTARDYQIP